jgi:hypothetical protein
MILIREVIKMNYFKTLPKIIFRGTQSSQLVTNLLARVNIVSSLITNPLLFYSYDIQEGDTPEIIAHKYYEDMERFWIVLLANQLFDAQWDWPLSNLVFNQYLNQKYSPEQLTDINYYEKIITTTDVNSRTTTTQNIIIDEDTYNNLAESTNTYKTITGDVVVKISRNAVDNFTYEYNLNESKRNIKILNKTYADRIEVEFRKLMGT